MSHRKPDPPPPVFAGRWKSTVREFLTAVVAFLPLAVVIGNELEINEAKQAGLFGIVAALSTALSSPAGHAWIARYLQTPADTSTPDDPPESDSRP